MNKLLLGCLIGILLVTGMMVFAQEKQPIAQTRIGSDAFFGQDPSVIKQKINEPPPPPPPPARTNGSKVSRDKKQMPANANTYSDQPANQMNMPDSGQPGVGQPGAESQIPGGTNPAPDANQPNPNQPGGPNNPQKEQDYIRGY